MGIEAVINHDTSLARLDCLLNIVLNRVPFWGWQKNA